MGEGICLLMNGRAFEMSGRPRQSEQQNQHVQHRVQAKLVVPILKVHSSLQSNE